VTYLRFRSLLLREVILRLFVGHGGFCALELGLGTAEAAATSTQLSSAKVVRFPVVALMCSTHSTPHLTSHTSHLTPHTSHLTPRTSHLTPHTSHPTPHTSHLTPHTSHLTPHTLHLIPHNLNAWQFLVMIAASLR
jgi:hypothetical protein